MLSILSRLTIHACLDFCVLGTFLLWWFEALPPNECAFSLGGLAAMRELLDRWISTIINDELIMVERRNIIGKKYQFAKSKYSQM